MKSFIHGSLGGITIVEGPLTLDPQVFGLCHSHVPELERRSDAGVPYMNDKNYINSSLIPGEQDARSSAFKFPHMRVGTRIM